MGISAYQLVQLGGTCRGVVFLFAEELVELKVFK
jgi:hypothetical protein